MPELPEVETIRRQMTVILPAKIISTEVSIGAKKNILHTTLNLKNLTITNLERKGKMLIFTLSDHSKILSHLGMTGTWLLGQELKKEKHSHIILKLKTPIGDQMLIYDDPRRFGHLYHLPQMEAEKKLSELGVDLISPEFTLEYLKTSLQKYPERALKVALLDQKYFAGSGNYIANEICAHSGILPTRLVKKITDKEYAKILKAIKRVLEPAISSGGTTFQGGYRDTTGEKGQGLSHLVVFYQKTCGLCKKGKIKKIILAQRGTYYCSNCQK